MLLKGDEALRGMRTEKKGVWLVVPLDAKRWSYGLIRHLEGIFFVPEVGSPLKEGIFVWLKGIGSMFRIPCLGIWSRRRKPGKSRCRRRILVSRTYVRGRGAFLDVLEQERSPWRDDASRDLPEAGEYAPLTEWAI